MIQAMTVLILLAQAKAPDTPGDREIRKYLSARAAELEKDFLPGIKTAEDFEKARPGLRQAYYYMLGLDPLPEKTPLQATVTGKLEFPNFTVERVHYQSRPGLYVTGNLYLPKPAQGQSPAIFYVCGHSNKGRDGNKSAYQDHGIWFATHGYVCMVVDTLQLGEIAAIHHGTYRYERWWWHSRGYTPAGVECWNGIRGIDYLLTRPEVDPEKIGVTGISGGGAATYWIAAADERVKAAVPVSGMADLGFYVKQDGVNGHCDCMFLYNQARWNWTTIASLVCPRAHLFMNSDNDGIFPMSANERISNRLELLYARFGASPEFDTVVSIGGHAYRTDIRRGAFEFFNRHFKQDARRVEDADAGLGRDRNTPRIATRELRVFPEDSDIPKDQINTRIDESFVPVAKVDLPTPEGFEAWRKDLVTRLRTASFGAWPARSAPSANGTTLTTEEGIQVSFMRHPGDAKGRSLAVLNPGEHPAKLPPYALFLEGPIALAPRATWTRKNPPNTIERSMALLGTTADTGRVWDVIAAARHFGTTHVIGKGQAGIIAAYAALYEPSIEEVTLIDPPSGHHEGPHFLNVLRVLDIPEALGCLAPRHLTIQGGKPGAFDRTAEIYRIAGAADRLERR